MRQWAGILFLVFMAFLFLEILVGFPIHLETDSGPIENLRTQKETEEIQQSALTGKPRKGDKPKPKDTPQDKMTEQKLQGVHFVESQKGSRDWEMFAQSAENKQSQGAWQLANVRVLFYNKEKVDFTVTGDHGWIDPTSRNMKIEGHVVTKSTNGYVFESETVIYQATERLIISPDQIKMNGPADDKGQSLILTGKQMRATVDSSQIQIQKNVVATKQLKDGKKFAIQSDSANFSGNDRAAFFKGNVSIEIGPIKMQGPEASFEYRQGVDLLQSVKMQGGVKVSDIDKFATSENVQYDPEQNKFTFNGHPRVVQNSDEITGDQIVFMNGGKKVRVEKLKPPPNKE
jgi:LPS export ABC transporter protein LptC/lipopolysaccharide transport protein LptA